MAAPVDPAESVRNQILNERAEREKAVEREYGKWKQKPHSVREVDSYSALALHPEANDYWAIWDSNTSEAFAKERALEYCNKAMKNGCTVAVSGKNLAMAIATVDGMIAEIAWDVNADIALMGVMKMCETKWGSDRCSPLTRIKPTKVIDSRLDFLNGHVPNSEQAIRYKNGIKPIERSSEPATNYIDQRNFEKEAQQFVAKWAEKIKKMGAERGK